MMLPTLLHQTFATQAIEIEMDPTIFLLSLSTRILVPKAWRNMFFSFTSCLWKRKIIFPATFKGDMLVPWRVSLLTPFSKFTFLVSNLFPQFIHHPRWIQKKSAGFSKNHRNCRLSERSSVQKDKAHPKPWCHRWTSQTNGCDLWYFSGSNFFYANCMHLIP